MLVKVTEVKSDGNGGLTKVRDTYINTRKIVRIREKEQLASLFLEGGKYVEVLTISLSSLDDIIKAMS